MSAEEVAEFLRAHPDFFEHHVDVLLNINVSHPHGGRTVSIPERQLIATREKVRLLEAKLAELLKFGEENDQLSGRIHDLMLKLIASDGPDAIIDTLFLELLDNFQVPHVALRLWDVSPSQDTPEFQPVAAELRQFVEAMGAPYCGSHPVYETHLWFGDHAPHLKSYALVPLRADRCMGVLLMASENATRFYADMGTLFLTRIGDVVTHCLLRHLVMLPASAPAAAE
ncbi:MAG: DUF484 family protein [Betaproteobacteria bacterium]|nr:DUF484 family protein [Betaproteobacteria bacterium]